MSSQEELDTDHSGLLSDATLTALQISHQPFAPPQSEGEAGSPLFDDEITAEQLADIKQALITGDDLLLILGEQGAGKTTLLSQLGTNSGLRIQCFAVKGSPRFSTMNLFAGMLEAFKRKPPETLKQILDELIPCLQTMVARNTLSAIVLDDAHKVNETELTQLLSGMLYINSQDETLMRVALAAPGNFEDRIPDLLPEGADLPYSSLTIDGLSPNRAATYVGFRLAQVGFTDEFPFSESDMENLVDQSAGLPAALHRVIADDLNERHGLIEDSLPTELLTESSGSILHSRMGKLALGALATFCIILGLIMFLKTDSNSDSDRYTVANKDTAVSDDTGKKLKLLKNEPVTVISEPAATPVSATDTTTLAINENPTPVNVPEPISEPISGPISEPDPDPIEETSEETTEDAAQATTEPAAQPAAEAAGPIDQPVAESEPDVQAIESDTDADATDRLIAEATSPDEPDTAAETPIETAADDVTKAPGFLESPNWILVQNPDQFTVQMSASRDKPSVENFLKRNPLNPPNSIFSFDRSGVTWYALVHGLFPSIKDAQTAVERLPASAQTNQPWIRSVGRVQDVLKGQ